jgi:N-acetyl-anhydromuramyl-L-alanine amidase AmpD
MPDAQQDAVGKLVRNLCDRFQIKRQLSGAARRTQFDKDYFFDFKGIAAHQNFRKDKWDVGPAFDWDRLGL